MKNSSVSKFANKEFMHAHFTDHQFTVKIMVLLMRNRAKESIDG